MTHTQIVKACEELGLEVHREPATGRCAYRARKKDGSGACVTWTTSYEGGMLGRPWVQYSSGTSFARTTRELKYLINS